MLTIALILLAILGILTICGFGYIAVTILSVIGPVILIYLGVKGLIHLFKKWILAEEFNQKIRLFCFVFLTNPYMKRRY